MADSPTVQKVVQQLLTELTGAPPETEYQSTARLGAELGIDSVGLVFLFSRIAEETSVTPVDYVVRTVGDVERIVTHCLANAAASRNGSSSDPSLGSVDESQRSVEAKLSELVRDVAGDKLSGPIDSQMPLADLGLDSQTIVALFVHVERVFAVKFDLDTPPSCFESIARMAEYLRSDKMSSAAVASMEEK
ncbi:acyl carrier protein [Nocardia camponoti]|uniref:acyl carrier protein n=1 Tax=Nocardia camponoti TaxID=1616106 RepID=UPI0016686889|nr:acyl carrier protein [Nocardia camponoti]